MKRCTPEDHPETELLNRTLPVIEEVASYLNRNITEHELQRKFLELCDQGAHVCLGRFVSLSSSQHY
jgi:hypothetical protein